MNGQLLFRTKDLIKEAAIISRTVAGSKKLSIDYDNSIIFLLACDYNNVGDILIRLSQEEFIKEKVHDKSVITVNYRETLDYLRDIHKNATDNTIIVLTGGGNVDDRYTQIERIRNYVIRKLRNKKCRIIGFPQTINYGDSKKGRYFLRKAQKAYGSNKHFVFVAREKKSYSIARHVFKSTKILLAPDIALSCKMVWEKNDRDGVGLLFRDDGEKKVDDAFLKKLISEIGIDYRIYKSDMVVQDFKKDRIIEYMQEKIAFVSKRKVIVTDRLHGMILCYITNTPCIVLPNANHKIVETYNNWLLEKQNFILFEKQYTIKQILQDIKKLIELERIKKDSLDIYYEKLADVLNNKED